MAAIVLTDEQIASFRENGFLRLPQIAPPEEVARLRAIFEKLFASGAGFAEGMQYDMVSPEEASTAPASKPRLPQIINPINYAPELRTLEARENALAIARQLLGPEVGPSFEHAILKPARYGAPTPWHQDEAHRFDPAFAYEQLSIWIPLMEATVENGCMRYIPGTNRGPVLEHRSPGNDPRVHALECCGDFDAAKAVPVPLPAGGCAIHHGRTVHGAGANDSDVPRPAYIMAFEVPPKPLAEGRDFPWNREKQTAHLERKRRWRRRGGVVVEAWRKVRNGILQNPRRLVFELRRVARLVTGR